MTRSPAARRMGAVPSSLDIYVTDACNMECSYCSSRAFLGSAARQLSADEIVKAADIFAAEVGPGRSAPDPSCVREITFTGGEPLLRYGDLRGAISRIRGKYPWLGMVLFTNGVLLTRARARFLQSNGVKIIVSLDGPRGLNDSQRIYRGGSAFDATLSSLRSLTSRQRSGIHLMSTFSSATAGRMLDTVRLFRTLACRDIHLGLDIYETWTPAGLEKLRKALSGLRRFMMKDMDYSMGAPGAWSFRSYFKDKLAASQALTPSHSLTLSPEGVFYPCDELCTAGAAPERYGTGSLASGLNVEKLMRVYGRVSAAVAGQDSVSGVLSPIDRYFRAVLAGQDPGKYLRNSAGVTKVFAEELGGLIEVERIQKRLAKAPGFGDLAHRPVHVIGREIRCLELDGDIPSGKAGLASARSALDAALYSPGRRKKVSLRAGRNIGEERLRCLSLYSLLKARSLGKELRLAVRLPAGAEMPGFFREHLIPIGDEYMPPKRKRKKDQEAPAYRSVTLTQALLPRLPGVLSGLKKDRCGGVLFRVSAQGWRAGGAELTERQMKKVTAWLVKSVAAGNAPLIINLADALHEGSEGCPLFRGGLRADAAGRLYLGPASKPFSPASGLKGRYASCAWDPSGAECRACLKEARRSPAAAADEALRSWASGLLSSLRYIARSRRSFRDYLGLLKSEARRKSEFFGGGRG